MSTRPSALGVVVGFNVMVFSRTITSVAVFSTLLGSALSPQIASADREILIRSSQDAFNFVLGAEATSPQGEQFLMALLEWATYKEESGRRPLGSVVLVPGSENRYGAIQFGSRESVKSFVASEEFGVVQFSTDMYDHIITAAATSNPLIGICGVIAALHSSVEMGVVPEDAVFENGKLKPMAIATAKLASGEGALTGTSPEGEKKMHEYFGEKYGKKVSCEGSDYVITQTNLMEVAEKIDKEKEGGSDCGLRATRSQGIGHTMHITDVKKKGSHSYEFEVLDTSIQGDGNGGDVPRNPGHQTIGMRGGHIASKPPHLSYRRGPTPKLWDDFFREVDKIRVVCCHVEKEKQQ